MATCDAQDLVRDAREFSALSPYLLRVIQVRLLIQILKSLDAMADCSATALMAQATEFSSLSDYTLQTIIAQLLCNISATGVGGVTPQVLRAEGAPTDPPAGSVAIYIDQGATAQIVLYWWNGTAWIPFG